MAEGTHMHLRPVGTRPQITTRDESGALCVQGTKQTTFGTMAAEGPPTTLSDTGVDRVAFLQGNLARDATYFLNGTPVGARDLFQARLQLLTQCFKHYVSCMSAGSGMWRFTPL